MNVLFKRSRLLAAGMLSAVVLLAGSSVRAETVTLADLLGGGSITVGDKLFDNFHYSPSGNMPDAGDIDVIPIINGLTVGLRFQGDFRDETDDDGSEALLTYNVNVLDPNFAITAANLQAQLNGEGGFFGIIETFLPDHPELGLAISANGVNGIFSDSVNFDTPLDFLRVQKNITAIAKTDPVSASYIDQTFIQVPEPSGIALLLVGGVGTVLLVARKRTTPA